MDITTEEKLDAEIDALMRQAKEISQQIEADGKELGELADNIIAEAEKKAAEIEGHCSEFEEVEKSANEALEKLVLNESQVEADESPELTEMFGREGK
ncbi:MAG: hypothetical protein WCX69_03020 [Candidatus Paceibacterota bacterium]